MAKASVETTGAKLVSGEGVEWELRLAYDTEETSGLPFLLVHAYKDGEFIDTPVRFKLSGNRLASDRPGVGEDFVTDGGHISDG